MLLACGLRTQDDVDLLVDLYLLCACLRYMRHEVVMLLLTIFSFLSDSIQDGSGFCDDLLSTVFS